VADDLDGDGKVDLLVTTYEEWPRPRQELRVLQNRCGESGNWIGFRLREGESGFSPVGAKVVLDLADGKQMRHLVTGDSYRSQSANTVQFGLSGATNVVSVEIRWPNGRKQGMPKPGVNQYHNILPAESK